MIGLGGVGAIGDALGGVLTGTADIIGAIKTGSAQKRAISAQKDIAKRQLEIESQELALATQQADKERAAQGAKLNTLLKFYGEQANADREAGLVASLTPGGGDDGGMAWLLIIGVGAYLLLKGK